MKKTFPFLLVMFFGVFLAGFLIGYFSERTGMTYTQSEVDRLKSQVDNMQLQEMFITGEKMDCKLMYSTMGSFCYSLYDLVGRLKTTSPDTQQFQDMKSQADLLSLKAWMMAKNVREKCTTDILPALYIYSGNCPECEKQDTLLQSMKSKYPNFLVYAVDFYGNQPTITLVKDAYDIKSTPAVIINHTLYYSLSQEQLEAIICENLDCSPGP